MSSSNIHVYSILLATCLFVIGQIFLRRSFDKDQDFLHTWCVFSITIGIIGCISLLFTDSFSLQISDIVNEKNRNGIIAGLVFAIGNLFWIYTISTKKSIGSIRTIMAGFETLLLFLVGYTLFSETFHFTKIAGIIMVLAGIYLIG